jgi:peptidoglycan hydrolase-like protein with peptidoglycan-binding domain
MTRKRITTLSVLLAVVVLVAAGSWIAGSQIQSPAEAAARTAPPTPSPILVPVEERVLSADVVTRGTARFGLPQTISLAPSPLKDEASVITTLPARGAQLNEGDVLLTASGRPLFVLSGPLPAYRDFVPGSSGADVAQLEQALERLGLNPGAVDGLYDEQTSAAVAEWVTAAGFEPFGPTAVQQATIGTLEQELAIAQQNQQTAVAAATVAPHAVEAARASAASANLAAAAEVATAAAAALERAQANALAVQLLGEVEVETAVAAQAAAEREADIAAQAVAQLTADLEQARRDAGVKLPLDEVIFLAALPARVEQLELAVGDTIGGPLLTVTNNQLAIDSLLPLDEALLIRPGMAVAIDEPSLGIEASGVVERVADSPGTDGVDGFHVYFETRVEETSASLEGFSLRLTIAVESTGGAVTAVPISALFLAADGSSRVQVDNGSSIDFVTVKPGLSADGFVEVTPLDGTLTPGQLVVIGFESQEP